LFALALLHQGYAAVYNSNFTGSVGDPGDGVDGWNQSEADNPDDPILGPTPKTWITTVTSNNYTGLAIGGFYDVPSTNPLTSTVSTPAIALVDPDSVLASVSLDFAINDSILFGDRNTFFFNVLDGSDVSIASVVFTPVSQTFPGTAGVDDLWNVSLNGNAAFAAVIAGGDYSLSIDFLSGSQFTATVTNMITNTGLTSGTTSTGAGSGSVIQGLQVGFDQGPGSDYGDNVFGIANVSVVPEPSSAMLVGLAALGLLRRRRA
jgi:hypothetical protein